VTEANAFAEIKYKQRENATYDHYCPNCGGGMQLRAIPCPDGRQGCAVLHSGWVCSNCGKIWEKRLKDAQ